MACRICKFLEIKAQEAKKHYIFFYLCRYYPVVKRKIGIPKKSILQ
jgi:hypothetical protein